MSYVLSSPLPRLLRVPPLWLLAILATATCETACTRPQQPPTLLQTLTCLDRPPPVLHLAVIEGGIVEAGCPPGLLCLNVPARVAWARWTVEMANWAAQTWRECGPVATSAPSPDA